MPLIESYRPAGRLYRATASGLNIARITKVHQSAPDAVCAAVPSHRWRVASTTNVNGLAFANALNTAGIELIGTNADEMNVSAVRRPDMPKRLNDAPHLDRDMRIAAPGLRRAPHPQS
jgi:hypothetical protein